MWRVLEGLGVGKQLARAPVEIRKNFEFWVSVIQQDGPTGVRRLSGFRDHALKGVWKGARASRLSQKWRVIYSLKKDELHVLVLEVSPHEY